MLSYCKETESKSKRKGRGMSISCSLSRVIRIQARLQLKVGGKGPCYFITINYQLPVIYNDYTSIGPVSRYRSVLLEMKLEGDQDGLIGKGIRY